MTKENTNPSSQNITIIADDLTGAADSAAIMAERGGNVVCVARPFEELSSHDKYHADVLSMNMFSRCIPGSEARELHREIGEKVKAYPNQLLIKKMDIAFRGNAAYEIEGLMQSTGKKVCFVMPSVCALNTFTLYGQQYAMGQLLEKSVYAQEDPIKAPKSSYVPQIMAQDTSLRIASVDIDAVKSDALKEQVRRYIEEGISILVFDAVSVADEERIVSELAKVYPDALWAGSLGVINAVASYVFGAFKPAERKAKDIRSVGFTASAYTATRKQLDDAKTHGMKLYTLNMDKIVRGDESVIESTAEEMCQGALDASVFLNISLSPKLETPSSSQDILNAITRCAKLVCHKAVFQKLVIVGGETAASILEALDINTMRITEKTETGIGTGVIESGPFTGKEIALKGGSVGSLQAISKMLSYE